MVIELYGRENCERPVEQAIQDHPAAPYVLGNNPHTAFGCGTPAQLPVDQVRLGCAVQLLQSLGFVIQTVQISAAPDEFTTIAIQFSQYCDPGIRPPYEHRQTR